MLMQMHEMQIDHDPDIATDSTIVLIAPIWRIIIMIPFDI